MMSNSFDQERESVSAVDDLERQAKYDADLQASIDRGLADADAGRLIPVEDLVKEFGIQE